MLAKSRSRKPAKRAVPTKLSPRGFGATASRATGAGRLLQDPAYDALYELLRSSPQTNINKVAVADFDGLRGVMALQDIAVGEEIVSIPAELAIDLGTGNEDPIPAALQLMQAKAMDEDDDRRGAYWEVLPPPTSADLCTADFFSEKEIQMLQWPPLVLETRHRSSKLRSVLGSAAPSGDTDRAQMSSAGGRMRELRWAVWLVLSRVLTVVSCPRPAPPSLPLRFANRRQAGWPRPTPAPPSRPPRAPLAPLPRPSRAPPRPRRLLLRRSSGRTARGTNC